MNKKTKKYLCSLNASMTVEAAFVLPIFLFAMITLSYIGLIIKCQDEMQWAMTRVVNEASAETGAGADEITKNQAYYRAKLELYMGGTGVLTSLMGSELLEDNDEIKLVAEYTINYPFPMFSQGLNRFRQCVHSRAFTGVDDRGAAFEDEEDVMVYVTKTGRVYHRSLDCTYLKLSISQVLFSDIEHLRNDGGGIYKPCDACAEGVSLSAGNPVWITNYGDRFHTNRGCSKITRSIREIPLSEVGSRTPCSKCGSVAQ